ncbi:WD40-repeat-containing domain protein [Mycena rosella]|uniref:WD40-repeat-containing domain protein n=1 Tax=Mycena rosella TaxID=1033263 RepID=A0AAD7DG07_MYCRO|nr:WD40-repeat-containing domain protein [Mycena rosella]
MRDPCLSQWDARIDALLKLCMAEAGPKVVNVELIGAKGKSKGKPVGILYLRLGSVRAAEGENAIVGAQKDIVPNPRGPSLAVISGAVDAAATAAPLVSSMASTLDVLLSKLDIIVKIGDEISQIHPYANVAWKILTSIYQTVKKQQETDSKLRKLVQTMVDVYAFVEDTQFVIEKIKRLENTVLEITKQMVECAIFIREHTGHGFARRLIADTWSDASQKIDDLSKALLDLKDAFESGLSIQTVFLSAKILDKVDSLIHQQTLRSLNPFDVNASLRPECLPGTRREILTVVTEWLTVASETGNVFWLHGVAGAGKSTIATTVSQYFRSLHRLGAFLFFDRNNPTASSAGGVIRTIAYWMAMSNAHIRTAVCNVIAAEPSLVTAPIRTQFQKLLLEPFIEAQEHIRGPIVIILDALDECGDVNERDILISLIANEFPKLPAVFRFFVTSRPEADITSRFREQPHIYTMQLDITSDSTKQDIAAYLRRTMSDIGREKRNLGSEWPGSPTIQRLADNAGGLFIWASTACRFIRSFDPTTRLAILLSADTDGATNLDGLYTVSLRNSADWNDETFAQEARKVIGAIVLSRVPLNDQTMDRLLGLEERRSSEVLNYLGCVVQWSPGKAARLLHASFSDYLMDSNRSGRNPWFIDTTVHGTSLATGCIRIMNRQLRFNICGLEDSHLLNAEVSDLPTRIETCISAELSYASQFWSEHLQGTASEDKIVQHLRQLFQEHFLHWLEVLSLHKQVSVATKSLEIGKKYVELKDPELGQNFQDAQRFLNGFAPVLAQSVPHIYISALPLAPPRAKIRETLVSKFPRTLCYAGTLMNANWRSLQKLIRHTDLVMSVAFSPDGKWIVAGSDDSTVRIWDSETSATLGQPLTGHTNRVTSVAFSPDGKWIVSGSHDSTVRIWDSETGTALGQPLTGHTNWVTSVAFSPDGKRIVSGSGDSTVRIWDLETGAVLGQPLTGHTGWVASVVFSPDGKRIVSGSGDSTVRIWDSETGTVLGQSLMGHTDRVTSVACSPDGKRIASGSRDSTVRIWDSETGAALGQSLTGHTDRVTSVAFSPDGKRITSGSVDSTVHIWDSETGAALGQPLTGHTDWVTCVAFSHDGKRIVSGSGDSTVRIWDSEPGAALGQSLTGHTDRATSVAFSPDGKRIVSGLVDSTVHIWDSETGATLEQPLTGHTDRVTSVAFSPDGKRIVSGSHDSTVRIWDSGTGTAFGQPLTGHTHRVTSVAFSHDGKRIASGSRDSTMHIWDSQTGTALGQPLMGHMDWVTSVAFSPDGKRIASGSDDSTVRIWDSESGTALGQPLTGHMDWVTSVAFSPDGKRIVSGSHDSSVRIWDSETGAALGQPLTGHTDRVTSVAFSPDGKRIASGSGDSTMHIWDSETGTVLGQPLTGHTGWVASVVFSPDGKRIVSGSGDSTVRIWDSETGATLGQPLTGHTNWVTSVAFSPDGMQIVSGSHDSTVRIWDSGTGAALGQPLMGHTDPVASVAFSPDGKLISHNSSDPPLALHPGHHSHLQDGWVIDSLAHRIIWIPPWLLDDFCLPWNSLVIGPAGVVKLDLGSFVHGTEWHKCIDDQEKIHTLGPIEY